MGFVTHDQSPRKRLRESPITNAPPCFLLNETHLHLSKLQCIVMWAKKGWG
jgi:hypothetical protein